MGDFGAPYGPMQPEDSFEYANRHLCYSLAHQSKRNLNQSLCRIYTDIMLLTKMIREENSSKFEKLGRKLLNELVRLNTKTPDKKLQKVFHDLMTNLGKNRSWRAYTNIINALILVMDTAEKYNNEQVRSNIDLSAFRQTVFIELEQFLINNFKEFITECQGEYTDISHYFKHVRDYSDNKTKNNSLWPAVLLCVGVIGLLYMFRRK